MNDTMKNQRISRWLRIAGGLALLPALLSLGACVVAYRPPYHEAVIVEGGAPPEAMIVAEAPPPVPVEVVTVAPAPGLVWVGGYWGWYGGRYVWVSGGWHRPPRAGAVWVGGSWARRPGGGHVWVSGRWR
jgi:hypothetical protein